MLLLLCCLHITLVTNQIEKVLRKFLKFAALFIKMPYLEHDYTPFANQLNVSFLADCRYQVNLNFTKGLLSGTIESITIIIKQF